MSLNVTKLCRTCLGLDGILSIYEGKCYDESRCIADMLKEIVNSEFNKHDGMPEKVCLACISEINRCYSFKIKCDNSNNTLKQLLKIPNESKPSKASTDYNVNQTNGSGMKSIRYVYNEEGPSEIEQKLAGLQDSKENSPEVIENNLEFNVEVEDENTNFAFDSEENETGQEKIKSQTELEDDQNSGDYNIIFTKFVKNTEDEESQEDISQKRSLSPTQSNPKATKFEYKCSLCPMSFVHNRNLIKHTAKIHNESEISLDEENTHDSKDECVIMEVSKYDAVGSDYEELQIQGEILSKDEDQEYHMEIIEIEENAEKQIVEQNQVEKEKSANELRCPRCSALFAMNSSLKIHIKMNKCTKPQFSCEECQKVFISQHSLKEHLKSHNFFCEICGESSYNKQDFDQHCAGHQGITHKHQCPCCKKVFTMRSTLNDHMRIHTGEKPFVCDVCGKAFNQNANLKQHVMRHNKTKPFSCDQCDHSFVSKGELYAHLRTHSGDQPFRCDTCPSAFTTSSSLVKHKRIHTGERPYSCDFCPMRFTALNTLKNHRRTHTGEKPFKCKFCPRAFAQKSDCSIHMRTHTGERRHTCEICKMKFQQSGTLRTHMKTHKNSWNKPNNVQCVSDPDRINSDRDRYITKKKGELLHIKTTALCPEEEKVIEHNDLLHFNIEECASGNGNFNEEEC